MENGIPITDTLDIANKFNIFFLHIKIENTYIESVKEFDCLGLTINENLNWKAHMNKIANKISKRMGNLNRLKQVLPILAKLHIYLFATFLGDASPPRYVDLFLALLPLPSNGAVDGVFGVVAFLPMLPANKTKKSHVRQHQPDENNLLFIYLLFYYLSFNL